MTPAPQRYTIRDMDVLLLIDSMMDDITPAYLNRLEEDLDDPETKGREFGLLPYNLRIVWGVTQLAIAKEQEMMAKSKMAESRESRDSYVSESILFQYIHHISISLMYSQVRKDFQAQCGLTICRGWLVCENTGDPTPWLVG